jgi:3-isopropylmalate/(R)-2-methylmalate dehydratase small subunit
MKPFKTLTAIATPFGARNVDTDIIIPARFLKAVTKVGMGAGAFDALRYDADGREKPECVFNQERYRTAEILVAGENFGCGSSREHAAWALDDMGYRVVIAPSFSDIFGGNAFKNGILTVVLPQEAIDRLMQVATEADVTVDLENQVVTTPFQDRFEFQIDPFRKHCLLNGLDEIGLTLQEDAKIKVHEGKLAATQPWLLGKAGINRAA